MIHKFLRIGGMTLEDPFLYLVIHVQPLFHLCYIYIYIYPDFYGLALKDNLYIDTQVTLFSVRQAFHHSNWSWP